MINCSKRLAGTLVGDIWREPGARTKYAYFFKAVAEQFSLVEVHDASLQGVYRYLNALRAFHPDRQQWRERFYKNAFAFRLRSRLAHCHFQRLQDEIDLVLQVGVLFNTRWYPAGPPTIIYTDYTAYLTAQRPSSGRSPFSQDQRREWLSLERDAFTQASHICTRSKLVHHSIIHDYAISPRKVTVIGGGVNLSRLPQPVAVSQTNTPTVLFIGKELHRKGGDVLLEAFARVRQHIPGARLTMVTSGPVPRHLPREGVTIIQPTWKRKKIIELYRAADVFVLPSRLETWGDVLLEAMSFALPCVGVTGQAMEEIIDHEITGLVIPAENAAAMAKSLIRLLADPDLRYRLGKKGREKVEQQYSWTDVVQRLHNCITQVTQREA